MQSRGAKYEGTPCKNCGGTLRLKSSLGCVICAKANTRKHRIARKQGLGFQAPTRPEPLVCECCGKSNQAGRLLCYDHDHKTGEFRGWLCTACNAAIGLLGDDIAAVRAALIYLQRFEEKKQCQQVQ